MTYTVANGFLQQGLPTASTRLLGENKAHVHFLFQTALKDPLTYSNELNRVNDKTFTSKDLANCCVVTDLD